MSNDERGRPDGRRRKGPDPYVVVRAAMMFLRSAHRTPSATQVNALLKVATDEGMRKQELCALMKQIFVELDKSGTDSEHVRNRFQNGNRPGTATEPRRVNTEPISRRTGTVRPKRGTGPEHHARVKTEDKKKNASAAEFLLGADVDDGKLKTYVERLITLSAACPDPDGGRLAERSDFEAWREEFGDAAFRHGVVTAINTGAGAAAAYAIMERVAAEAPDDSRAAWTCVPLRARARETIPSTASCRPSQRP